MTEEALAAFFQADAPMRISTLSSERMIVQRLINLFGENHLFNEDVAAEMKRNMIKDLEENRKEEYMSEPGKFKGGFILENAMCFSHCQNKYSKSLS